jgi:hypothetical protein
LTLKGEAKTKYMRKYMRRWRAEQRAQAKPQAKPAAKAAVPADAELAAELARLKAENARLKAELASECDRREAAKPAEADLASLPKSSRERFEALVRRQEREYTARVRQAVEVETRRFAAEVILPGWRERLNEVEKHQKILDRILDRRAPLVSKKVFRIFRACVQPDSRGNLTNAMLHDAAVAFNTNSAAIEIALCGKEAERPKGPPLPTWEEMKARAENRARAKRAAASKAKG